MWKFFFLNKRSVVPGDIIFPPNSDNPTISLKIDQPKEFSLNVDQAEPAQPRIESNNFNLSISSDKLRLGFESKE
jgi:hypothetical protein